DGTRQGSILGSRLLLPGSPRRSGEAVVVGWRRAVPVRQEARTRPLCVAARRARTGGANAGAAVDAAGRHRLAAAGAHLAADAGGLTAAKCIGSCFGRVKRRPM